MVEMRFGDGSTLHIATAGQSVTTGRVQRLLSRFQAIAIRLMKNDWGSDSAESTLEVRWGRRAQASATTGLGRRARLLQRMIARTRKGPRERPFR